MKKKCLMWLPFILMAAVCVSFASCGDDDDDIGSPGGNVSDDRGADGLKGYWATDDVWTMDSWSWTFWNDIYYLDGEGGGTRFCGISYYENTDNVKYYEEWYEEYHEGWYDEHYEEYHEGYTEGKYIQRQRSKEEINRYYLGRFSVNGKQYYIYNAAFLGGSATASPGEKYPITYAIQGSTLQIYSGGTNLTMLNISNKQIVGCSRMQKID